MKIKMNRQNQILNEKGDIIAAFRLEETMNSITKKFSRIYTLYSIKGKKITTTNDMLDFKQKEKYLNINWKKYL